MESQENDGCSKDGVVTSEDCCIPSVGALCDELEHQLRELELQFEVVACATKAYRRVLEEQGERGADGV